MRILFLGDVVGRGGRNALCNELPKLRERYRTDFVIVNGENAAGGFGITETICNDFIDAGADVITTGNHIWDQRETFVYIERQQRLLRPANYPAGTPGRGAGLFEAKNGAQVVVINVMGRIFMDPLDCPFRAADNAVGEGQLKSKADAIFVDVHAEASSEKQAMAYFLDGRVSAVVGTHTHVPTADERILPGGTAYITDVGMCGDYQSVIGMQKDEPVQRFVSRVSGGRFEPAMAHPTICGVLVETDDSSGLAISIQPVRIGGILSAVEPARHAEYL